MSAEADKGCMTDNSKTGHIAMEGRFTTFSADTKNALDFLNFYHVRCEHEGSSIPLEGAKHLGVTEELSEVDVEQVAAVLHHYIVVVPVADAQDVRDDAVSRAGPWNISCGRFKFSRLGGRQACRQTGLSSLIAI